MTPNYEEFALAAAKAAILKGHADTDNLRELLIWTTCITTTELVEQQYLGFEVQWNGYEKLSISVPLHLKPEHQHQPAVHFGASILERTCLPTVTVPI